MPRNRKEKRTVPLLISTRIKFYNGIVRFLCHCATFLYTLFSDHSNAEITHMYGTLIIHGRDAKPKITAHDQTRN